MAKTATIQARIEVSQKMKAEIILKKLGVSSSKAIGMLYQQIILQKGIPFDFLLDCEECKNYTKLNRETMKVLRETDQGRNLIRYKSENEALKDLSL